MDLYSRAIEYIRDDSEAGSRRRRGLWFDQEDKLLHKLISTNSDKSCIARVPTVPQPKPFHVGSGPYPVPMQSRSIMSKVRAL